MQLVFSDPKTRKAYSKKIEDIGVLSGKRIGEKVVLDSFGLNGYEAKITGGSDKTGTPMRFDLPGSARKRIVLKEGSGYRKKRKGMKKKKGVRGNIISGDMSQVNLVILKPGEKSLEDLFPKAEKKEEEKESIKEKMIKESHEAAAKMSAEEAQKIKGKIKK